jgi:hypothetical protein
MSELPNHERLLDLLAQQATEGLSGADAAELEVLLRAYPKVTSDEMDRSVAAILLASKVEPQAMPAHLAARILAGTPTPLRAAPHLTAATDVTAPRKHSLRWRAETAGWWAAAACLLLAVAGWWPRLMNDAAAPSTRLASLTPEQQRAALLDSGRAVQAAWSPGSAASGKSLVGDVVFDPRTQRGYLRFRGLPANDPRLEQYQLWIADAARVAPEPVDGGVFDTPQTTRRGDVIIPFEATLPVGKPAAFVVTVERPGGVVVSKQERVLALAKVTSG